MKTVLVTGVSGFVGGHVALQLLNAGHRVRGSLRILSRADRIRDEIAAAGGNTDALELVSLDLLDDSGWAEAMDGVDQLHHVASPFVIDMPDDPDELIRPAVAGTERALQAALAANVERIVLTSSSAAVDLGHPSVRTEPFTEKDWTNLDSAIPVNAYARSKTLAERRAWELMRAAGRETDLVTINPVNIYGPLLGTDIGTSGIVIRRLLKGDIPATPRLNFDSVDVRDVAALHLAAMDIPAAGGQRVLASASRITLPEMADLLRKTFPEASRKVPRLTIPDWIARIYALFNKELRDNINFIGKRPEVKSGRAATLLGHRLIPAADAFLAMARTMIERDLVDSSDD